MMERFLLLLLLAVFLAGCVADETTYDMRNYDNALRRGDFSLCGKIHDSLTQKWCYVSVGNLLGSPESCQSLEDPEKALCLSGVASARKDPGICEELGPEEKEECQALVAFTGKDPRACQALKAEKQDMCYISQATSRQELALCEEIKEEQTRETCYLLNSKIR